MVTGDEFLKRAHLARLALLYQLRVSQLHDDPASLDATPLELFRPEAGLLSQNLEVFANFIKITLNSLPFWQSQASPEGRPMLVQCPKCSTTYKVSDEVIKGSAPAFRCSRCKHTFELEAETQLIPGQQQGPAQHAVETDPEAELTFAFPVPPAPLTPPDLVGAEIKSEKPTAANDNLVNSASQETAVLKARQNQEGLPVVETDTNTPPVKAKQPKGKKDFAIAEAVHTDQSKGQESDSVRNILPMASYVDQRASIFPYMTLFGLLAIGFGLVAVMSQAHPGASAAILRNIPIVGPMLLKNIHLKEGILIRSLRSGYQGIQGNREVFVVTGVALNQNPVVIREVQITGKVFNDTGRELEQQTIWLGNTISPKIIRGMTTEDIPHLQNLKPLKSFEIPPGDSVPFTIVFLRSAKAAKDFTCQVITAAAEV